MIRLSRRSRELLDKYHGLLTQQLRDAGINFDLEKPTLFGDELELFNNWKLQGFDANFSAFSEQNAIECVDFLVSIMVKSHQFCSRMPTVGGEVQLAVIKKDSGFQFVSRREWRHGDYVVPIQE